MSQNESMKMKLIFAAFIILFQLNQANAQHVKVRMNFPGGISIGAPGPRPYHGAIWIGPEWQWRNGNYVSVPGYWARPKHPRAIWVPGHWKNGRHGYRWIPGHWK